LARWRAIWVVVVLASSIATFEQVARAEQAVAMAEARQLFERGVELFSEENYPAALVAFQSSYELRESPVVLFNIAMCQRAIFRFPDAIDSFREYLRRWGEDVGRERRDEVEELVGEMNAQLLLLTVNVSVTGAEVLLDGELVGSAPLSEPLRLGPGEHVVEARAPGHDSARTELTVTGRGERAITLVPRPLHQTGRLRVTADAEGAQLVVDGEEPQQLPTELELSEGAHTIEVTAPDHEARNLEIEIAIGETHNLEVHLEPSEVEPGIEPVRRPWYATWWFWTAVGVVVTGGVVAGVVVGTAEDDWGAWDVRLP